MRQQSQAEWKQERWIGQGGGVLRKLSPWTWRWSVERDEAKKAGGKRSDQKDLEHQERMDFILKWKTSYQMILSSFRWMAVSSLESGFKETGKRQRHPSWISTNQNKKKLPIDATNLLKFETNDIFTASASTYHQNSQCICRPHSQ